MRFLTPFRAISFCLSLNIFVSSIVAQDKPRKMDLVEEQRMHEILKETYITVKKEYYDPTFHGIDLEERFRKYDQQLNSAPTPSAAFHVLLLS